MIYNLQILISKIFSFTATVATLKTGDFKMFTNMQLFTWIGIGP